MKLQRKLTNKEWEKVEALGPGVHTFRGKKTLFYNGAKLWEGDEYNRLVPLIYNYEERQSWQIVIVLPGVEIIPEFTFSRWCTNVMTVIMADTVKRIEWKAFSNCKKLLFVRLSKNLECIGGSAFRLCESLTSIFIPPSCREIGSHAFQDCRKCTILHIPQDTQLNYFIIGSTALMKASPFETTPNGWYEKAVNNDMNKWIKNINQGSEEFALHRECASFCPSEDGIYEMLKRQGLQSFLTTENEIGVTASRYLQENPFSEIDERKVINRYVLDMIGEIIT